MGDGTSYRCVCKYIENSLLYLWVMLEMNGIVLQEMMAGKLPHTSYL